MKTIRESPVLRSAAKTGKTKYWQLLLVMDATGYYLARTWWQEGSVRQTSAPELVVGKNTGRANATSALEQAERQFASVVQKRRDKGFSESGHSDHVYTKPMLAHNFNDRREDLVYPVLVQPKLDGYRMLMDGENAWTRGGKDHVRACVEHLIWDTGDLILDGELLLPGNKPLQVTAAAAKKFRPESSTLQYHVYDVIEPDVPYTERKKLLEMLLAKGIPRNVRLVSTQVANDEAEVLRLHRFYTAQGYEGSIIRDPSGLYEIGFRSHGLLKLKDTHDAEYTVVGVEHGKGSFVDKAKLVFSVRPDGKVLNAKKDTFTAVPEGDAVYRKALWDNREQLPGQVWTVRYISLSADGKPVHAVAVAPRGQEDR